MARLAERILVGHETSSSVRAVVAWATPMHLEALQEIALRVSGEHTVNGVLRQIVDGLARQPDVALARVWVVSPGDLCDSCYLRSSCADRTTCLHLAASAGASLA